MKAKLEERRKRLKAKLKEEKAKIDEDVLSKDPLAEEELENKKNAVMQQHNREAGSRDLLMNPGGPQGGSIMLQGSLGMPGVGPENTAAAAQEQQNAAKLKQEQEANFQKLLQGIDVNLQTSQLLETLKNGQVDAETLEKLMKQDEEDQARKLQERRELLRQRKALKKNQELEQLKMAEQLAIMQEEDSEKAKIGKTYLKDMFNQLAGATSRTGGDAKNQQQERLVVFNEYASDALLQRLSNLLLKQFVEKEAALKLLVQKYMDARLIEKTHIKREFKGEYEKLAELSQSG